MMRFALSMVLGLSLASAVAAQAQPGIPDPSRSDCPLFVYVVGRVHSGADADTFRTATAIIKDFANNPVPGATVTLDFSGCCDIALCEAEANGQPAPVTGSMVTGVTDANGRVDFHVMGAAKDPGTAMPPAQYGGCGSSGVWVRASIPAEPGFFVVCRSTAVSLDLNGAAGGSNGTSTSDVANMLNLFGSIGLGAPYKGRGDLNADGHITAGDVSAMLGHVGRLGLTGGVGCTAPYVVSPACP